MNKKVENKKHIDIIAQAFYGNRTFTSITADEVDRFILGYLDSSIKISEKIDRTIVRIPDSENVVLVYNKYEEEEDLERVRKCFEEDGYEIKPLAVIPELDLKIYSRCIACRINEAGDLESLCESDCERVMKYLAR